LGYRGEGPQKHWGSGSQLAEQHPGSTSHIPACTSHIPGSTPNRRDPALLIARGHVPEVVSRRLKFLRLFAHWLLTFRHCHVWDDFLNLDAKRADAWLAAYGRYCFEHGRSRLSFAETINAVVDQQRSWRRLLEEAWDVCWVWKGLEASGNNLALPAEIFQALIALALVWNWVDMCLLICVGFLGMLRPGELSRLTFGDLLFVTVNLQPAVFVRICQPKMRRIGPRREHVRIDDGPLILALKKVAAGRCLTDFVLNGTQLDFATHFRQLLVGLDLPYGRGHGLTPASLRAGGATFWYHRFDSTEFVRFRGRWANSRMLEVYIQEVAATSLLQDLPFSVQQRIGRFAAAAAPLLSAFIG
jgi:hypothetical protein